MSVGLLLLAGCSKENTENQIDDQTADLVWVYNIGGKSQAWETMAIDELSSDSDVTNTRSNGNSAHTHGDFTFGSFTFEWSGTENSGGTHGSAFVTQVLGGPFGTVPVELTMETECIMAEGNEAVYGGTFTEVVNSPFPPGGPFDVGNHMYWKVTDNGQGNNAPPDQHNTIIVISPSFSSRCGVYTPPSFIWGLGSELDVQEPGSVKVNN